MGGRPYSSGMATYSGRPAAPNTDPDFPGADLDYDLLDFDARDELDAEAAQDLREIMTGRPARPGTRW